MARLKASMKFVKNGESILVCFVVCLYLSMDLSLSAWQFWDFPGCPVVRALPFHCRGHGFDLQLRNQDLEGHMTKTNKINTNLKIK